MLVLVLMVSLTGMGASSCPFLNVLGDNFHGCYLIIENQTLQTLTIFFESYEIGKAAPGGNVTASMGLSVKPVTIAAKNSRGELVFLRNYAPEDYERIREFNYKAVIPPDIPSEGPNNISHYLINPNDIKLTVYINNKKIADLGPGENTTGSIPIEWLDYFVSARDIYTYEAFRKFVRFDDIQKMEEGLQIPLEIPYRQITFQNDTYTVQTVIINGYYQVGDIKPGESLTKTVPWYTVWAKWGGIGGPYVLMVTREKQEEIENNGWKVVIKPEKTTTPP